MSAGNFGRSFSFVCGRLGFPLTVIMPVTVPRDRVEVIEGYGATVELLPRTELQNRVDHLVAAEGMVYAHSFDDLDLIAGYGSIIQEIEEELRRLHEPQLDLMITGVGGGGLFSGLLSAQQLLFHDGPLGRCHIHGVEPVGANKMCQSVAAGHAVKLREINSIVNGLSAPYAGEHCFQIVQALHAPVMTVTDEAVRHAMRVLADEFRLFVESAGAASLAALLAMPRAALQGQTVCLIVSGGNVSLEELTTLVAPVSASSASVGHP
jgi:threonine dehydratase